MPVSKGKDCWGDVMGEFKRGQLHSGKKGPVVKSRNQAKAIAASMCNHDEMDYMCGPSCDCPTCGMMKKRKANMMALGYSEDAVDRILSAENPQDFSEEILGMVRSRVMVIQARAAKIQMVVEAVMAMEDVDADIEQWAIDKITLAADYISAAADNIVHGDAMEIEEEEDEYSEEKVEKWGSIYKKGLSKKEQKSAAHASDRAEKAEKEGKSKDEVYKSWPTDKKERARLKKAKLKMPKSASTVAYEKMYGKDSEDHAEGEYDYSAALKEKAEKSGIPLGILRSVYAKGVGAWKTGHRPGTTPQQWGMARVNSFITGSGKARQADADLWKKASAAKKKK